MRGETMLRRGYGVVLTLGLLATLAIAAAILTLVPSASRSEPAIYEGFRDATLQLKQAVEEAAGSQGTVIEAEEALRQTCQAVNQTLVERGMKLEVLELSVAGPARTITLAYRVWCGGSFLQSTLQAAGSGSLERPLELSLTPAWANWTYKLAGDTILVTLPSGAKAYVLVGYVLQNLGADTLAVLHADPDAVWIEVDGFRYGSQEASTWLSEGESKEVVVLWLVSPSLRSSMLQAWPEGSALADTALALWERQLRQLAGEASLRGELEVSG